MTANPWVVLDLDGTVVDIRPRHYAAHLRVAEELHLPPVDPRTYWRIKRTAGSVAGVYGDAADQYQRRFIDWIEAEELLELDQPFRGAVRWLGAARGSGHRVVIATGRQNRDRTVAQLGRLAVAHDLLVTAPPQAKAPAVLAAIDSAPLVWIGDTEQDIDAARELGVPAVATTSGIRSPAFLTRHRPDALVSGLRQLRLGRAVRGTDDADHPCGLWVRRAAGEAWEPVVVVGDVRAQPVVATAGAPTSLRARP